MQNARDLERSTKLDYSQKKAYEPPLVFNSESDQISLGRLEQLKSDQSIHIVDIFEDCLFELFYVDFPAAKLLDKAERDKLYSEYKANYLAGKDEDEAGTWVYFHKGSLIHILDKDNHYRLRTSRNIGLFNEQELAQIKQARVAVAGLSVGGVCAQTMAMEGFRQFYLADFDELSCSNLNRLPASLEQLGYPKTDVQAQKIWHIDPFAHIERNDQGITEQTIKSLYINGQKPDVIVDAVDSLEGKIIIREYAQEQGIPVVWMMDIGDGLVQIGIEPYHIDKNYPAFHGRLIQKQKELNKELNYAESILALLNPEYLQPRMYESFIGACNCQVPGISQLAGTVSIAAGAISRTVRSILLKESFKNEFVVSIDTLSNKNWQQQHQDNQNKMRATLKEEGFLAE